MRMRDVMLVVLALGGLATGVVFPKFGLLFSPWTVHVLMAQLFFSFLGVDFRSLARVRPADAVEVGVISAAKLFFVPILFWTIAAWLAPGWALPVLLMSGVSTGVTAPFIANLLGSSPHRMLQVSALTSALVPFTLPALVTLLLGQRLDIPYSYMARMLALVLLPPGIVVFLLKRFSPGLADRLNRLSVPLGIVLFFFVDMAIIAPFAGQVTGRIDRVLAALGMATLLNVAFVSFGLGMSRLRRFRLDGLTGALGLTCINNTLVAVFAARFFGSDPTLLAVLYMFPYFLILFPMRWVAERMHF